MAPIALRNRDLKIWKYPCPIITLDIETGRPFVFSTELTPEAPVATAVRCSTSIPGVFAIRRFRRTHTRGWALTHIRDLDLFPNSPLPLVTIRLVRDRLVQKSVGGRFGLATYITRVASILLDAVDRAKVSAEEWKHTLFN